jgi:sarcosine oxidase
MTQRYDVAVIGLGAMGSMTAWHLAQRGLRVIGFDRFAPPHSLGSAGGLSRMIREAYSEQPFYVPMIQRAYELWAELERRSGRSILQRTGALVIGERDSATVAGAVRSAADHHLTTELLTAAEVRRRWPAFQLPPEHVALHDPRGGALAPEVAIGAALDLARAEGAVLRSDDPVEAWEPGTPLVIRTAAGRYEAGRIVLAAGAWMSGALPAVPLPLTVLRQPMFWFEPRGGRPLFHPSRFPVFLWQWTYGHSIYGFPDQGEGFKVAIDCEGPEASPDQLDRTVAPGEEAELVAILARYLPDGIGPIRRTTVCMYTNTADEDFILGRHPADGRIVLASPCSGHGFKFSVLIGEICADLAMDRAPRFDLTPFRLDRPSLRAPPIRTGAHS